MHVLAIVVPVAGASYLMQQIQKRDLRGWQHYACLTSLVFLISVLCLIGGGRIKSFGLAGNTIEVVDQKLEEIRKLTEQNKRMAQETVALVSYATSGLLADPENHRPATTRQSAVRLLELSGMSDSDIKKFFDELVSKSAKTNSP